MFRKLKVDEIFECITKTCWQYGVQYETVIKSNDYVALKMYGTKKSGLFIFQKTLVVFFDEYERAIRYGSGQNEVDSIVYITTGVFDGIVKENNKNFFKKHKIKLIDGDDFVKCQLGLTYKAHNVFKNRQLRLLKFIPF
jgi:hypothetical protein